MALLANGCSRGHVSGAASPTPVASPTSQAATTIAVPATADEAILAVNELSGKGDLPGALTLSTESLKTYPGNYSLLVNRGSIYLHTEQYSLAETDFTQALTSVSKKDRWTILSQRARCAMGLDQAAKAEKDFAEAVKAMADDPDPPATFVEQLWRLRGSNLVNDLRFKESIPCFTEALKLDPQKVESLMMRGLAYSSIKDQKNYQKDLASLEKLNPEAAAALKAEAQKEPTASGDGKAIELAKAGTLKLRDQDYQAAIKLFDQSLALDPKLAQAYQKRGSAYQSLKDYGKAIGDYTASFDLNQNEVSLFNRAICYLNTGDLEKAEADLDEFLKISKSPNEIETAKKLLATLRG